MFYIYNILYTYVVVYIYLTHKMSLLILATPVNIRAFSR